MAIGRKARAAAKAKLAAEQEQEGFQERHGQDATAIDPSQLDQDQGQMPIAAGGKDRPPEQLQQWTLAQAREKYGREGTVKWCINCKNMNFESVHGIYHGQCILRPRKESRIEMDFTCEEFEKAGDL